MFGPCRQWIAVSLVSVAIAGCDATQPIAPPIQEQSATSSQSTVNAPSSLSIVASQTRLDLTWQDNSSNETGFEVRRSTDGATGSFPVIAMTGANTTAYADTGLMPAKPYCYKVRAVSVGRKTTSYSAFSDIVCATTLTPPGPPQAPENEYAIAGGSQAVSVSWADNSNNEDGFRLERSGDAGATWVTAATTAANVGSIADYDVASEAQFCYRVSAFNRAGVSSPSNTSCTIPIAGPTNLVADKQGLLTWTDNSALEDGYEVWMLDAFGEPGYDGLVATLPPNATSVQTGGCGGWCHGFAVVAVKDGAYSDWAGVQLPPAVPTDLTATAVSATEVDLSWDDAPSNGELFADMFIIERCTGDASGCGDAGFVEIATSLTNWPTAFQDTRVLSGTTYTYRVRAYNQGNISAPSNTATATTPQ